VTMPLASVDYLLTISLKWEERPLQGCRGCLWGLILRALAEHAVSLTTFRWGVTEPRGPGGLGPQAHLFLLSISSSLSGRLHG
jgi:hypothetical protein